MLDDVDQISTPLRRSSFSAYLSLTGSLAANFDDGQGGKGGVRSPGAVEEECQDIPLW